MPSVAAITWPVRILWLTWKDVEHPLAGGAETVSSEIGRRFARDGHEVTFVTSAPSGRGGREVLERDGYRVVRAGGRLGVYWQAFRYVRRHLRGWPDVVIEEINTIPFFSRFYLGSRKRVLLFYMLCRRIWFYQLPPPLSWIGFLVEPLYLRLLRGDPTIALSDSTRNDLIRHGFAPQDVSIMPAAIQLEPLASLEAATKYERPTVVSLGNIRPMKRTLEQVRAFELARDAGVDLQLKVAGAASGRYGQQVLDAISRSRYHDDIEVLGRVTEEAKTDLLRRSHLILVTSVKEGWGLIVTEAASQGTPAVVYDVDGLRDSVRSGETGVVTACDPGALAEGVAAALVDHETYERLRRAAWEWSRELTFEHAYEIFAARVQSVAGNQLENPAAASAASTIVAQSNRFT